jgi:hypothetical protein
MKLDGMPDAVSGEFLLDTTITLAPAVAVGDGPFGTRTIYNVVGGTFEGPMLRGTVHSGGGDWLLTSPSHNELDVRATIETDDGALIYVSYRGVLKIDQALVQRVIAGEDVSPSEYYFRTSPRFETGHEKYAWLNSTVCVAYGRFGPNLVEYRIFAIT